MNAQKFFKNKQFWGAGAVLLFGSRIQPTRHIHCIWRHDTLVFSQSLRVSHSFLIFYEFDTSGICGISLSLSLSDVSEDETEVMGFQNKSHRVLITSEVSDINMTSLLHGLLGFSTIKLLFLSYYSLPRNELVSQAHTQGKEN